MTPSRKIDPAVWYRADWEQCDDWIIELTDKEIQELKDAVSRSQAVPIANLRAGSFTLPAFASRIRKLRDRTYLRARICRDTWTAGPRMGS